MRELSARHGSSTRTVHAALDLLRKSGKIESKPGAGLWRAGQIPTDHVPTRKPSAQDLSLHLAEEIRQGGHPWNAALPSIKELAIRWGCHPQTAAKALDLTLAKGMLERKGRSFFPARPRNKRLHRNPSILCLGMAGADGRFRMDTDREADFWRSLGSQAAQSGLSLVRRHWNGGRILIDRENVGVVAATWHQSDREAFYQALDPLKIPVCVWMEDPTFHERIGRYPSLRFHDQGYWSRIGAVVARHLLDRGHKRIAYLSPWHASLWSKNRLKGVSGEIEQARAKLDTYCLDRISEWDWIAPAAMESKARLSFPERAMDRFVEGRSIGLRELAVREIGWNRIKADFHPLLDQALGGSATAWICANDASALMALDWLTERGIEVPGKVALAGFDDSVGALRADLTSYRFDSDAMSRAMIHQILSKTGGPAFMHHEGFVVPRGSTLHAP